MVADLGRWEPLSVVDVVDLLADAPFRWWISGGRALALHLGETWRPHEDTDVGVARSDAPAVHRHLRGWDLHVAAAGVLSPWDGRPLDPAASENNVWVRRRPGEPWALDLTIGDGTDDEWVYRRDPSLRLPWGEAVLRTSDGVPYLAPELQLLYKSRAVRPKDQADAERVIACLEGPRCAWLAAALPADHPWQDLLAGGAQ